jgi:hypothetical protein
VCIRSFNLFQGYRHWRKVNFIFHKTSQKKAERGRIWRPGIGPPPFGRSITQVTACSRILSPHRGCAVAMRHVAGALTGAPTYHGTQVAILRLSCTLVARVGIIYYACVQVELLFTLVCFEFLCGYYFVTSTFM